MRSETIADQLQTTPNNDEPLKYRKLRIAWSVVCGVACLLLVGLWAHTVHYQVRVEGWVSNSNFVRFVMFKHWTELAATSYQIVPGNWYPRATFQDNPVAPSQEKGASPLRRWQSNLSSGPGQSSIVLTSPFWFSVLLTGVLAVFPWLRHWPTRFSYVGACQVLMGFYMFASPVDESNVRDSRRAYTTRSEARTFDGPFVLVLTSKAPRRAHSAIRAQEDVPPAHEISCASDDAHSVSRALDVESVAQSAERAIVPRRSLRGPAVQSSRGRRVFGKVLLW